VNEQGPEAFASTLSKATESGPPDTATPTRVSFLVGKSRVKAAFTFAANSRTRLSGEGRDWALCFMMAQGRAVSGVFRAPLVRSAKAWHDTGLCTSS
jgi:hypothetical protein